MKILTNFYRTARPWGFWGPVHAAVIAENPEFVANKNFRRDMFNIVVGVVLQTALVALPIYVVIKHWGSAGAVLLVILLTALILKYSWYDRLPRS